MKNFEIIPHTADLQIRVWAPTIKDLFKQALISMFQVIKPIAPECTYADDLLICPDLPIQHAIELTSMNQSALLIDFLSEALYLSDVHNQAYLDATIIELTDTFIQATIYGIPIQGFQGVEIKAVTYHNLSIQHTDNHVYVDITFDI